MTSTFRYEWQPLEYYKTDPSVADLTFATAGSACFDLAAFLPEDSWVQVYRSNREPYKTRVSDGKLRIEAGARCLVPTGLIFNIKEGWSVRLHPRSGIALKKGLSLANGEGIIDSDYVEPTFVMLTNTSQHTTHISNGDRVAQAEMVNIPKYKLIETQVKPGQKTERSGGFGSTGE